MTKAARQETTLPFELGIVDDHYLEVSNNKHWLALLQRKSPLSFNKLAACITAHPNKEDVYVIALPKYYGLSAGEEALLQSSSSSYRSAITSFQKILVSLHERTGLDIKKCQELMSSPLEHLEILSPEDVASIADVSAQLTASQDNNSNLVTVIIQQRLCPTWSSDDTQALHQDLFKAFADYCNNERNQWQEPTEDPKPLENQTSTSSEETLER